MIPEELESVITTIRAACEQLDDLIYSVLRDAVANGADKRPDLEKRLTRCRNALERAVAGLESVTALDSQ